MKKCSKCNADSKLTEHHIFPQCFSRYLSKVEYQSAIDCTDTLCKQCHQEYEQIADELKNILKVYYGYQIHYSQKHIRDKHAYKIKQYAELFCDKKTKNKTKQKIRKYFQQVFRIDIDLLNKKFIRKFKDIIADFNNPQFIKLGKFIVDRCDTQCLITMWFNDYNKWLDQG